MLFVSRLFPVHLSLVHCMTCRSTSRCCSIPTLSTSAKVPTVPFPTAVQVLKTVHHPSPPYPKTTKTSTSPSKISTVSPLPTTPQHPPLSHYQQTVTQGVTLSHTQVEQDQDTRGTDRRWGVLQISLVPQGGVGRRTPTTHSAS